MDRNTDKQPLGGVHSGDAGSRRVDPNVSQLTPTDQDLTESGLLPMNTRGRVLLLACGALAREILALIKINGWQHMELHCLPAILHNTPVDIPDAVEAAVHKHQQNFDQIFVVYADCGTCLLYTSDAADE